MISSSFIFFYQIQSSLFWLLWNFFKNDVFFSITSFNIKLIKNWAYWLSPSIGFHGLQV